MRYEVRRQGNMYDMGLSENTDYIVCGIIKSVNRIYYIRDCRI